MPTMMQSLVHNMPSSETKPISSDALDLANCIEKCAGINFIVSEGMNVPPEGSHWHIQTVLGKNGSYGELSNLKCPESCRS